MKLEICKCDRCGRMIYGDKETKEEVEKLPVIISCLKITRGFHCDTEMDLCFSCQKELYKWATGREWKI